MTPAEQLREALTHGRYSVAAELALQDRSLLSEQDACTVVSLAALVGDGALLGDGAVGVVVDAAIRSISIRGLT